MQLPKSSELTAILPGDSVEFWFEVKTSNQTLLTLAVHEVNKTVYADERFDMQGIRYVDVMDPETGRALTCLVVTVTARKTPRHQITTTQEANVGAGVYVIVGLVAAMAATVIAYSGALAYRGHVVLTVLNSNQSEQIKVAALTALDVPKGGLSGAAAQISGAIGGGFLVAAVVLGLIWLVGHRHRGSGD